MDDPKDQWNFPDRRKRARAGPRWALALGCAFVGTVIVFLEVPENCVYEWDTLWFGLAITWALCGFAIVRNLLRRSMRHALPWVVMLVVQGAIVWAVAVPIRAAAWEQLDIEFQRTLDQLRNITRYSGNAPLQLGEVLEFGQSEMPVNPFSACEINYRISGDGRDFSLEFETPDGCSRRGSLEGSESQCADLRSIDR